jgi:L-ribulose-5-phosphate 3-epimerase
MIPGVTGMSPFPRREFLRLSASTLAAAALCRAGVGQEEERRTFQLSLSERSLTRRIMSGELDHLDFARVASREFDIKAVDYASRFFKERVDDESYLTDMNKRAADQGVRRILLLVDDEGPLAAKNNKTRAEAVRNHRRWIDAALALGCRGICVQVHGEDSPKEQTPRAVETLSQLAEYGTKQKINVLVANDAGAAANPAWLLEVIKQVDSSRCAAFPLFNGFGGRDPYEGMAQLMSTAKGVCATARDFNGEGNETNTDFPRMVKIVLESGYRGYVSLEYQGEDLDELEGIRATQALLQAAHVEMT